MLVTVISIDELKTINFAVFFALVIELKCKLLFHDFIIISIKIILEIITSQLSIPFDISKMKNKFIYIIIKAIHFYLHSTYFFIHHCHFFFKDDYLYIKYFWRVGTPLWKEETTKTFQVFWIIISGYFIRWRPNTMEFCNELYLYNSI